MLEDHINFIKLLQVLVLIFYHQKCKPLHSTARKIHGSSVQNAFGRELDTIKVSYLHYCFRLLLISIAGTVSGDVHRRALRKPSPLPGLDIRTMALFSPVLLMSTSLLCSSAQSSTPTVLCRGWGDRGGGGGSAAQARLVRTVHWYDV